MTERISSGRTRQIVVAILGLGMGLGAIGCGNASMSGRVTLDKKPVVFGTLLVVGPDSKPHYCQIAPDGSYSVADITPGAVKVAVNSSDPKSIDKNIISRKGVDAGKGKFDHITGWFPIPAKYGDFNTSGLTYTLSRGDNSVAIELADQK